MKQLYKLASFSWDSKEFAVLKKKISQKSFSMGKDVIEFEKKFAKKFKCKYAVMSNSGTSANLLAFIALFYKRLNNLKTGDEILVPGLSWSTTFSPLHLLGLKLIFIDIDYSTLNINENLIEESITKNTKAIFIANILGKSCNLSKIRSIAKKHKLYLVEDNCESLGASHKDKYAGTYGIMGTFSFFFSHHLQTMEGGMTVTNNYELFEIMKSCRAHGWTRDLNGSSVFKKPSIRDYTSKFHFILPGLNLRPLELSAAVGLEQLKKMDLLIKMRRKNAIYFYKIFKNNNDFDLQKFSKESSFFAFPLIKKSTSKINLKHFANYLIKNGVEIRPIAAGSILLQPVSKYYLNNNPRQKKLKISNYISNNSFYVGNGSKDLKKEIDYLNYLYNSY